MAAGVTIHPDNLDAFRKRLNELARVALKPADLQPPLRLDAEVALEEITGHAGRTGSFEADGAGESGRPILCPQCDASRPLQRMGAEKQHVKMWVTDGVVTHEGVWWGAGDASVPEGKFDLAFVPQINEFNGRRSVQLKVLDWRSA